MKVTLIAVHKDVFDKVIAFRLFDVDNREVKDYPYDAVLGVVRSGKLNIDGIEFSNGKLKGSNGSFDRYPTIVNNQLTDIKTRIVILASIDNIGYRLTNGNGAVAEGRVNEVVNKCEYEMDIANGKIVTRDGKKFISSINGTYDNIPYGNSKLYAEEKKNQAEQKYGEQAKKQLEKQSDSDTPTKHIVKSVKNEDNTVTTKTYAVNKQDGTKRPLFISETNRKNSMLQEVDPISGMTIEQKLSYTMLAIKETRPFYYSIISLLKRVELPENSPIQSMGVSLDTLYFSPEFVLETTLPELLFIMLHEVCHVAMKHRAREENREHDAWNVATDYFINKHLSEEFGLSVPGQAYYANTSAYSSNMSKYKICLPEYALYSDKVDADTDVPEKLYQEIQQMQDSDNNSDGENQSDSKDDTGSDSGNTDKNSSDNNKEEDSQSDSNSESKSSKSDSSEDEDNSENSGNSSSSNSDNSQEDNGEAQGNSGKQNSGEDSEQENENQQKDNNKASGNSNSDDNESNEKNSEQGNSENKSSENEEKYNNSATDNNGKANIDKSNKSKSSENNGETGDNGDNSTSNSDGNFDDEKQRQPGRFVGKEFRGEQVPDYDTDIVDDENTAGKSPEQMKQMSSSLISQAVSIHRQRHSFGGDTADFLERYVEKAIAPRVNWRSVLKKFLTKASQKEYTFAHPDKRFLSRKNADGSKQVFAGPHMADAGELENIKICIDTSGSISPQDIGGALVQINDMFKRYKADAELLYWDTRVRAVYPFKEPKELLSKQPMGGGGTDVNCVFDYFDSAKEYKIHKKQKPSLIIIFTDGCFGEVDKKYKRKYKNTIWIVHDNDRFVAPFGVKAPLKLENL